MHRVANVTHDRKTIFALSSGQLPAAIAVIRISGPGARAGLLATCGRVPEPRRATFARLRDPASQELIDEALVLWFPGPSSETGEEHGRAAGAWRPRHRGPVVCGARAAGRVSPAEAGEFTRRALSMGGSI